MDAIEDVRDFLRELAEVPTSGGNVQDAIEALAWAVDQAAKLLVLVDA
jgi:hypothetical protein